MTAGRVVRRLVAHGSAVPRWEEGPLAAPGEGELTVRAAYSMVSPGTELHYLDRSARTGERFPLGYCSAGVVDAVGTAVHGFRSGDRVIAMGWGQAVHADVVTVPFRLCRKVPAEVGLDDAVVADLAATAVHAVDRAQLEPADEVVVVGAGIVGQLVALTASARGCPVTLLDRRPERLHAAAALGLRVAPGTGFPERTAADVKGGRCVFLCTTGDASATLVSAARWAAAAAGRPRLVGVGRFDARVAFSVELGNLDIRYAARCGAGYRDHDYECGRTEVTAPPGEGTVTENLQRALDLVADGVLRADALRLPRFSPDDAPAVYAALRERPAHPTALFDYRLVEGTTP